MIGYEIGDDGEILDEDGDVVGRATLLQEKGEELAGQAGEAAEGAKDTAEGAAEDAQDTAEGVAEDAQDQAEEVADGVETYLPELSVLKGLEVQENGDILDKEGNAIGRINEGDPADLVGMALNEDGEILDEDGGEFPAMCPPP